MRTFYLYYDKSKIVDPKQHMKAYNHETAILGVHEPKLVTGAPILQNVDGSYIKQSDIPSLVCKSRKNFKLYNEFHWLRDYDGRVVTKR